MTTPNSSPTTTRNSISSSEMVLTVRVCWIFQAIELADDLIKSVSASMSPTVTIDYRSDGPIPVPGLREFSVHTRLLRATLGVSVLRMIDEGLFVAPFIGQVRVSHLNYPGKYPVVAFRCAGDGLSARITDRLKVELDDGLESLDQDLSVVDIVDLAKFTSR